jgi:hypothetical protein
VYPWAKSGFGKPARLETTAVSSDLVLDAALDPGGEQWLVRADSAVRWFVHGKEKPLPSLKWYPWSIGFLRDDPVVAVVPRPMGDLIDYEKLGPVPALLRLEGDDWATLLEIPDLRVKELHKDRAAMMKAMVENAVYFAGDKQGKLWVAGQYAYRLKRLSSAGRSLLEIRMEGGKPRQRIAAKAGKNGFNSVPADPAILDLTEGRDGNLYLVVHTDTGGLALDRYDRGRSVLERIPLDLDLNGRLSLAAGKDALYIASWNGQGGRWKISWAALDEAKWQKLEGVEVSGSAADEDKAR